MKVVNTVSQKPPKAQKQAKTVENQEQYDVFPIVGIGASAGGLEAFVQLLKHLDVKTGMAFVFIQHLDPSHKSLLSEILGRATKMNVVEVTQDMKAVPDVIYVMPSNSAMTISANNFRLLPRPSKGTEVFHPIDEFFESLATNCNEKAVGIVLSGTGSDGARGIGAISAAGGITFAEDRRTAKFDSMPMAAMANGVDYVLSPTDIGKELDRLGRLLTQNISVRAPQGDARLNDTLEIQGVLKLLKTSRGTDFTHYKRPTVLRRILRRMHLQNIETTDEYVAYLKEHPQEIDSLYEDILIKVTSFFRDAESFRALREEVFTPLLNELKPDVPIRIWVPGCATGEEAYSIAICLRELLEEKSKSVKVEIFATDISDTALAQARLGRYDANIAETMAPERLARYFFKEGAFYRVVSAIRECCVFATQNVTRDPPFSKLDLISCRNLLIYFSPETQKRVLSSFHFALNPGGWLTLGNAETIGTATDLFEVVDKAAKIFVRKPDQRRSTTANFSRDAFDLKVERTPLKRPIPRPEDLRKTELKSDAERAILKFVPPSVVVNARYEIQQFRGDTSAFLLQPTGEPTTELFKMCRPGLLLELRGALQEAATRGESVRRTAIYRGLGQTTQSVTFDVLPFVDTASGQSAFVIMFTLIATAGDEDVPLTPEATSELKRLEYELAETKDYLNSIIEKEQATNEELKSASEEILSANEELQSTNEEMATAKEETQATNEELVTVNDELQSRNQELTLVNDDLANIFGGVQFPIVMLNANLAVRRFTPSAEKAFNLTDEDIGRPLSEIGPKLKIAGLEGLAVGVLDSLNTLELDIQDREGLWYSLRIKPYRTTNNKIDGIVMGLVDIDINKRSFDRLQEAYEYADAIVQTAPVPLLILNENLTVNTANQAFYRHFQVEPTATTKQRLYDLGNGQWNISQLRVLLEDILPHNDLIENFVVDHVFPFIGRRIVHLSARRLIQPRDKAEKILLAFHDITAERQAEEGASAAREASEAANRAKSEFLANMSHEIRTPLGAILGYSELLANPEQTRPEALHSATRIRRNVEHLTELIDEILDIAKIEAGKLQIERVQFDLLSELAETCELLQNRAQEKNLDFVVSFDSEIPETIFTCPRRLRQILINIGGNALKFTEVGSVKLSVKTRSEAGKTLLVFEFKDTGCGLNAEQQERLFAPFSQADSSVTRKFGGTGLGLTLARELARSLGGDVTIGISELGKGSTFIASIDTGSLEGVRLIKGMSQSTLEQNKVPILNWFVHSQRLAGVRVLLVEDGPDNQLLITHFLSASGARVELAINGIEAIAKAKQSPFEVILMDIQMPIMDGYEASRSIRAGGNQTPIVALTAHAMEGERERCIAAGCTTYLSKPLMPGDLIDLVESIVKKTRKE